MSMWKKTDWKWFYRVSLQRRWSDIHLRGTATDISVLAECKNPPLNIIPNPKMQICYVCIQEKHKYRMFAKLHVRGRFDELKMKKHMCCGLSPLTRNSANHFAQISSPGKASNSCANQQKQNTMIKLTKTLHESLLKEEILANQPKQDTVIIHKNFAQISEGKMGTLVWIKLLWKNSQKPCSNLARKERNSGADHPKQWSIHSYQRNNGH